MTAIAPDTLLLNWLLVLPFFSALCIELFPRLTLHVHSEQEARALARGPFVLGALVCVMGLGLSVCLLPLTFGGSSITADYWWTRDLYHLRLRADALCTLVLLALYGIGLLIHMHLLGQPAADAAHHRSALLVTAIGCGVTSALSADLILLTFSVCAAFVALWLLAALDAPRASNHLLGTAYIGGLLITAGVLIMWQEAGETSIASLQFLLLAAHPSALRLIGILFLLGMLPCLVCVPGHGWLPRLTRAGISPALAPAVLLPLIGGSALLRLLPGSLLLPNLPTLASLGLILGLASLWWGAVRAYLSQDLRHLASWLTVVHSGYLLIALAAAAGPTASPRLLQAASLHLLLAPLALLAVWCAASAVAARVGTDSLPALGGLLARMPIAALALLCGGLSLVGLPPLAGFLPQRLLLSGLAESELTWLMAAILAANLLVVLAVLDAFRRAFLRREPAPPLRWNSPWLSVTLSLLVLALLVLGLWTAPLTRWAHLVFRTALSISP